MHILSLVTDNCLSFFVQVEGVRDDLEIVTWSISTKVVTELGFELVTPGSPVKRAINCTVEPG